MTEEFLGVERLNYFFLADFITRYLTSHPRRTKAKNGHTAKKKKSISSPNDFLKLEYTLMNEK